MKTLSKETETLITQLQEFSGKKLKRSHDIAILIECSLQNEQKNLLEELSFFAKFIHNTFSLMKKVGRNADGYDKLSSEFSNSIKKSLSLIKILIKKEEEKIQQHFQKNYAIMSAVAMENLLDLLHDLSWLKNFSIDKKEGF